ncbi:MAG: N-acetylneuraminate synthase family protein [Phycisphaerales bacterium]|nr:N-acetylneuraminate synthase family protein [Phycisphaerales bacterium]
MHLGSRPIGPEQPPYIIAEIGVNHDGSTQRALELVEAAKHSGANAVKVQYFEATDLMSRACRLAAYQAAAGETDPVEMLAGLQLNRDAMAEVVRYAHSLDLHAIVTIFSIEHASLAIDLDWDALKVASPDIINTPLLTALAAAGKPIILSTGAADAGEIARALRLCGEVALHCVSAYPTPEAYAQIAGIPALADLIGTLQLSRSVLVGYSDHTSSHDTGALAVVAGACVLEKHLTWRRSAKGPDHAASLDPALFARYVQQAHRAWSMLGPRRVIVQEIEQDVRTVSRQSITSTRDLTTGETLTREDLTIKRPGTGLLPALLDALPGRKLARDVPADTPLTSADVEGGA